MDQYEHVRRFPLNVVLAALGFETFKYRKAGTEGYGACPIHGSKKNTTCFSFDDDGRFNCFSCSAKGKGAIDLKMAVSKCGFQEAVEWLKGISVLPSNSVSESPTQRYTEQTVQPFGNPPCGSSHIKKGATAAASENPPFKGTYEKYYVPSDWLAKRGILPATLETFGIGQYDNPKRQSAYKGKILLPVRRWKDGELVAYLARDPRPEDERGADPKYIWPKGFQKSLEVFGAWQIKNSGQKLPLRVVYVVESPFCVLKFHQLGLPAVSPFGYSVSAEQVAILAQIAKGVCYLPDRDKSQAVAGFVQQVSTVCWIRNPELPEGVDDPEQLSFEQIRSLTGSA